MQNKQEFYAVVAVFLALMSMANIVYVHSLLQSFHINGGSFDLNGNSFRQVGMMQYENPADKQTVYFPIYIKR